MQTEQRKDGEDVREMPNIAQVRGKRENVLIKQQRVGHLGILRKAECTRMGR